MNEFKDISKWTVKINRQKQLLISIFLNHSIKNPSIFSLSLYLNFSCLIRSLSSCSNLATVQLFSVSAIPNLLWRSLARSKNSCSSSIWNDPILFPATIDTPAAFDAEISVEEADVVASVEEGVRGRSAYDGNELDSDTDRPGTELVVDVAGLGNEYVASYTI